MNESNVIDYDHPNANMFGIQPCPKCGDEYRCIFKNKPGIIQCDHCGYEEKADNKCQEASNEGQ